MNGYRYRTLLSSTQSRFYRDFSHRFDFLKTKHDATFVVANNRQIFILDCQNLQPGNTTGQSTKMTDYYGQKPRMSKFHTELSNYARVQKERAKYLSTEEIKKSRMKGRPITVDDIQTWGEYATNRRNKKSCGDACMDVNNKVSVWQGDITRLAIGAICNAANKSLLGGGGVDGAIHRAAGNLLYQECKTLCGCNTGEAKMSAGYLLPANYVIHTVGPIVHSYFGKGGVDESKRAQLKGCYESCLNIVLEHNRKHRQRHQERKEAKSVHTESRDTDSAEELEDVGGKRLGKDETEESSRRVDKAADDLGSCETSATESEEVKKSSESSASLTKNGSRLDKEDKIEMDVDAAAAKESCNKTDLKSPDGASTEKGVASSEQRTETVKSDEVEKMEVAQDRGSDDEGVKNHKEDGKEGDGRKRTGNEGTVYPPEPLIDSIAFPCISTGIYGYPQDDAVKVALSVCREWLERHPENELKRIIFCVYLDSDLHLYEKLLPRYFPLKFSDDESSSSSSSSQDEDTSPSSPPTDDKTSDRSSPSHSPNEKQDSKKYKPNQQSSD